MALFDMGAVLAGAGILGSGFGLDFDEHLGIQAVGLPDTDIEADLPGNLEADLLDSPEAEPPGNLEEGLLDSVVAADPDNSLEAGRHLGIEDWAGTLDQDIQTSVVAGSSHGPLRLVDEPLALRQNPSVPVHSD